MKTKLAIFDLDGTLFDTREVNYLAYKKAFYLVEKQFDVTYEEFNANCFGKNYKDFITDFFGLSLIEAEEIHEYKKKAYESFLSVGVKKNDSLFDILHALSSQYYIALVTTASRKNVNDIMECFSCRECFELMITGDDVVNKKPSIEGYQKAMDYFAIKAKDTIIFEDAEECVLSAKEMGATVYKVVFMKGEK